MDREAVAERARELFASGYNCAQSTSLAVKEAFDLDVKDIPRVMQPFGGGVGRSGEMCGAVTGAVMSIGMLFGEDGEGRDEGKERCVQLASRYMEEFRRLRGSVRCPDLLGYDLGVPEQAEEARASGAVRDICPGLVGDSIMILLGVIEGELERRSG